MRALILVDLQADFAPGGALPVPEGDAVIPVVNKAQDRFEHVVATLEWHPKNHGSFAANHPGKKVGDEIILNGAAQILSPVHCVQHMRGADVIPGLNTRKVKGFFRKGTDPLIDSYSGFFDNGRRKDTGLNKFLQELGIKQVYLVGLSTEYCVKFTALDAKDLGYDTFLIEDGCRAFNFQPGDSGQAIGELKRAGVTIIRSSMV